MSQYGQIVQVIAYLQGNPAENYKVDNIAKALNTSVLELEKEVRNWSGSELKDFLHYIHPARIKNELSGTQASLFAPPKENSISQNAFVHIQAMPQETQAEWHINYAWQESPFGKVLIASTELGLCFMAFYQDQQEKVMQLLRDEYPMNTLIEKSDIIQDNALSFFNSSPDRLSQVKLHIKGTDFQFKVWRTLLETHIGHFTTYRDIAHQIGQASASRAVGTAIGRNSVAYFIPCHRVVRTTGKIGEFKWGGAKRKLAINAWEKAWIRK